MDGDNAREIENLRTEAQALQKIRQSMGSEDFPKMVFTKVFGDDIDRLRSMEDMWKSRKPPTPLSHDELASQVTLVDAESLEKDRVVWTMAENFAVFTKSILRLSDRMEEIRANSSSTDNAPAILTFDKDDVDILDFVVASANLRSLIFGIETRSKFDIKRKEPSIMIARGAILTI